VRLTLLCLAALLLACGGDDDVGGNGADAAACEGEYLCAAPVALGPFACRTVCVCDSAVPEGGFPVDC
jgi:hypothetical protein